MYFLLSKSAMNRLLKQIIHLPIKLIFFLFGSINASASKQNLFNRLKSKVFSQWMCLRFNCQNCTFDYPFGYRHGNRFFKIGVGNRFAKHTILTAWSRYKDKTYKPEVTIGNNCIFGGYLHLTCCNSITIGNDVLTGRWVTITDNSNGECSADETNIPPASRPLWSKGKVIIEDSVWIGDKATILPNVTLGKGCIIGANSVVTKDIPPYAIACGNPAKVIRYIN